MQLKNMTIGIIGCGLIADTHVEAIKKAVPNSSICVCDPLPGKAELLKKKYELKKAYCSIEEMLSAENPFSVHILSPPQLHVAHTLQCLEWGCNVLAEKPLALNCGDVDKLFASAKKHNKVLCVDHILLCQPSVVKMLQEINSSNDRVLCYNSFFGLDVSGLSYQDLPQTHWKRNIPGGAIVDTIIHPVTLATELTGRPIDIKTNFLSSNGDIGEVLISWQSEKAMCSITVSVQAQPFRRVTEVTTDKHTFTIDHGTETLVSLSPGFGPKSLRKLQKNFGYASQLIMGTIGTVINVIRGKLSENPGARRVIEGYYRHLSGEGEIPVSEENVRNSAYALDEIVKTLSTVSQRKDYLEPVPESKKDAAIYKDNNVLTLLTGASGYLGRHICAVMTEKKRRVVAQVRRGGNSDKIHSPYIDKMFEDFNYDPVDYTRLVEGKKQIIHCAHASGAKTWNAFKNTNVDATLGLYEAAKQAGCDKFIFISSVAVYGVHQRGHVSVSEEARVTRGKSKWDYYISSKIMAENLLLEKSKNGGPKLLIIRPGILYSADGTQLTRRSLPYKGGKLIIRFGNGKNILPYTRVDVLARTICDILELDPFPQGIYNMTGNPEETSNDFVLNRMEQNGVNCRFLTLPATPLRLIATVLEFLYSISFRKTLPKITRYIINSTTRDIIYDCSKAERDLGWNPKAAIE